MKKLLFLMILPAFCSQLKAQQLHFKQADSLKNSLQQPWLPRLLKPDLKTADIMATNTFRINYMNLSTGYYQDKMPIAVLPGNSKMPVLRDSGSYTMPVARITDGNKAQVMELQKLQTPAFKFPAQLVPVPQEK